MCLCLRVSVTAGRPVCVPRRDCGAGARHRSAASVLGPRVGRGDQWHYDGQHHTHSRGALHPGGRRGPLRLEYLTFVDVCPSIFYSACPGMNI